MGGTRSRVAGNFSRLLDVLCDRASIPLMADSFQLYARSKAALLPVYPSCNAILGQGLRIR